MAACDRTVKFSEKKKETFVSGCKKRAGCVNTFIVIANTKAFGYKTYHTTLNTHTHSRLYSECFLNVFLHYL